MGRQKAVIIVPDEIRQTHRDNISQDYATFQCIEDVSKREGFQKFYFRQTDTFPNIGKMNKTYLWPEKDIFKFIISRILGPLTPIYAFDGRPILKRLDLLSSGFIKGR